MIKNAIRKPDAKSMKRKIAGALLMSLSLCFLAPRSNPPPPPLTKCVEETGDIPFTVRHNNAPNGKITGDFFGVWQGPFARQSRDVPVGDITANPCTFYAIRKTIFPHTGVWKAFLRFRNSLDDVVTRFNVNDDTNRVDITVIEAPYPGESRIEVSVNGVKQTAEASAETATQGVNPLQQSQAPRARQLAAEAWLGDSQDPSGTPDSDRWFFLGNAGDSLIVRVEPDNKGGNNEGQAILRFIGPPTKQVSGKLPLRIDVDQLASTGRYDIEIEQAAGQGEERYRGGYTLTLESAQGTIHDLSPTDSVEK